MYDVCLNTYGTLDLTYKLLTDNQVTSIEYTAQTGDVFVYDDTLTVNPGVSRTKTISDVRYATLANVTPDAPFN